MFLLVSCFLLLAHVASAQQHQDEEDNYGAILQVGFRTSFSCVGRVAGYYADIESGCQLYHMCDGEGRRFTHACPNATLFQQRMMICDHYYMVNCNNSEHDYSANLLIGQRDKPFVSAAEHLHHREPVKFFTISQNPGSLQQPNWFPSVNDRVQDNPADTDNTVHSKTPSSALISSVHISSQGNLPPPPPPPSKIPLANRQARNKHFNSETSYSRSPPPSATKSHRTPPFPETVDRRPVISSADESGSVNPQYFQTRAHAVLPDKYTNNPFLRSLILRTTPPTLSNNDSKSLVQTYPTVQSEVTQRTSGSNTPVKLEDIANIRIPSQGRIPDQFRKTKEFSVELGSTGIQNLPFEIEEEKLPDSYTNNPFFQTFLKTRTSPELPVTTPRSINLSILQGSNTPSDHDNDLNNTVELHLLDPRRMFFIPGTDDIIHESDAHALAAGNSTVLFISLPPSHDSKKNYHGVMRFRNHVQVHDGRNPECPKCHPGFLLPGRCHPCVIIR